MIRFIASSMITVSMATILSFFEKVMKKYKITYVDPKTGETKVIEKEFENTYLWTSCFHAIECARKLADGNPWEVEEVK